MSRSSSARDPALTASGSSDEPFPVAVTGGEIFWRGVWQSREAATRLRDEFARRDHPAYFRSTAKQYADAPTDALRMTVREDA